MRTARVHAPARAAHAVRGSGLPEWFVASDLRAGRLVRVLDDWTPSVGELCLYYPQHRYVPPALQAFVELIRQKPRA